MASIRENLTLLHARTKCADQSVHPRSLTSAFVIRSLERIKVKLAAKIKIFLVVSLAKPVTYIRVLLYRSLAKQTGLSLTLLETRRMGFSRRCVLAAMSCASIVGIGSCLLINSGNHVEGVGFHLLHVSLFVASLSLDYHHDIDRGLTNLHFVPILFPEGKSVYSGNGST